MTAPTIPARRKPAAPLGPVPLWERDKLFQEPALPEVLQSVDEDEDQDD